jgi:hypothetical protein
MVSDCRIQTYICHLITYTEVYLDEVASQFEFRL